MATHSSILAWRIPWTEGSGGLHQSLGSQRVGHDWVTDTHTRTLNQGRKRTFLCLFAHFYWGAQLHTPCWPCCTSESAPGAPLAAPSWVCLSPALILPDRRASVTCSRPPIIPLFAQVMVCNYLYIRNWTCIASVSPSRPLTPLAQEICIFSFPFYFQSLAQCWAHSQSYKRII